jgi:hypothetical protein
MELIHKKQMVKFSRYSLAQKKKSFRPQRDCFCKLHFLTSCGIYLHSKHLKIIHSMHLKMHQPWYMKRNNTMYWSQISGIMEHLTSCGVYIHSMLLKLHLPCKLREKIHCTGARFLVIMEQSSQRSLSFYKPSYCAFICSANYEPQPFFIE